MVVEIRVYRIRGYSALVFCFVSRVPLLMVFIVRNIERRRFCVSRSVICIYGHARHI